MGAEGIILTMKSDLQKTFVAEFGKRFSVRMQTTKEEIAETPGLSKAEQQDVMANGIPEEMKLLTLMVKPGDFSRTVSDRWHAVAARREMIRRKYQKDFKKRKQKC